MLRCILNLYDEYNYCEYVRIYNQNDGKKYDETPNRCSWIYECGADDHRDKHSISVFRRTHKGAHRHTLVCTASRCCALLQHAFTSYFHTRTFTQMLLHTSQHTHTSLYTHIFTHMRLHSGFSTQAVAHMQYTYVFTQALLHILNTDTHALVHKHSCTHTLLHKPFHTLMLHAPFSPFENRIV